MLVSLLDPVGDGAALVSFASDGKLVGASFVRSDSAHITEMGQSYAEKKSVSSVDFPGRISDVDVVTVLMQTLLPLYPPQGNVGTHHSLTATVSQSQPLLTTLSCDERHLEGSEMESTHLWVPGQHQARVALALKS